MSLRQVDTPDVRDAEAGPAGSRLLLVGLALGYFLVLMDTTVVTVALPAIGDTMGGGLSGLQWVVNGYTLSFAALLLSAGVLADRHGGRRVFLIGLVSFVGLSLACAAAPTIGALVAARVLLGMAGALLLPASLAVIASAFPDAGQRARALGSWAAISGAALAVGPTVGGVLTQLVGWRAIFLVNVPVGLLAVVVTARRAPDTPRVGQRGIDLPGQVAAALAMAALIYATIEGGRLGWRSNAVLLAFAVFVIATTALVVLERGGTESDRRIRILPAALFRISAFSGGLVAGLVVNFALSGLLFVLSLFLQHSRHYNPVAAGLSFLPLTVPTAVNPIFTGRLVARIGSRRPAVAGFVLMAVGAAVPVPFLGASGLDLVVRTVGLFVLGCGISLAIPALMAGVIGAVPPRQAGVAGGALNSARQVGAALGVAVLGVVLNSTTIATGTRAALLTCVVVLLAGAVTVARGLPAARRTRQAPVDRASDEQNGRAC